MSQHAVVVGGGITGLMCAHLLRTYNPDTEITLIERSAQLGGLLGGFHYPERDLYFDQGTHIMQETGNDIIDKLLLGSLKPDNLIHYPVGKGDCSGAYFSGVMQTNSHFPDLTANTNYAEIIDALVAHAGREQDGIPAPAREAAFFESGETYFGARYTYEILAPLLAHMYQRPADDLSWFAAILPGLSRVITQSEDAWLAGQSNARMRALLGFPEQRRLPNQYRNQRRSFYARSGGSAAFMSGIAETLRNEGVNLSLRTNITGIDIQRKTIESVISDGNIYKQSFDQLWLTNGIVGAAFALGTNMQAYRFDRPMPVTILNYMAEEVVPLDVSYFYGLDTSVDFYRVTHYATVCENPHDRRLTVEVIGTRAENEAELSKRIAEQLVRVGAAKGHLDCVGVHSLPQGFPIPTVNNLTSMQTLKHDLRSNVPDYVKFAGIGSESGLFFQNEVVQDLVKKVTATCLQEAA